MDEARIRVGTTASASALHCMKAAYYKWLDEHGG